MKKPSLQEYGDSHRSYFIGASSRRSIAAISSLAVLLFCNLAIGPVNASAIGEEAAGNADGNTPSDRVRALDANRDGKLAKSEATPQLKEDVDTIDANKNGHIDVEELTNAVKQAPSRAQRPVQVKDWTPDIRPGTAPASYSPQVRRDYPTQVYWGDTHVHTNLSNDAFAMGNQVLSPDMAYRFAKGEAIETHGGMKAQLGRPLDFLVVSDHAFNMGVMARLAIDDPLLTTTEQGKRWLTKFKSTHEDTRDLLNGTWNRYKRRFETILSPQGKARFLWLYFSEPRMADPVFRQSVWNDVIANAERHNDPGNFTAFIGYEWTSGIQHRNVIFRDDSDRVSQVLPFSCIEGRTKLSTLYYRI